MFIILSIMIAGFAAGFFLRNINGVIISKIILFIIWLLLFLLGVDVGGNDRILSNFGSLGLEALIITLAGLIGSGIGAKLLWRYHCQKTTTHHQESSHDKTARKFSFAELRGSFVILSFFILGVAVGYLFDIPLSSCMMQLSYYTMLLLMFVVGMSLGNDRNVISAMRQLDRKLMWLPLTTIVGTLLFSMILIPFLPGRSFSDTMAVSSGFGYYSLSAVLITDTKGAELGTIALLANIMREIATMIISPLLKRIFGPLAPISAGAATSMDTTLPIVTQVSGKEFTLLSIYHGVVVDIAVLWLVPFFCSL